MKRIISREKNLVNMDGSFIRGLGWAAGGGFVNAASADLAEGNASAVPNVTSRKFAGTQLVRRPFPQKVLELTQGCFGVRIYDHASRGRQANDAAIAVFVR